MGLVRALMYAMLCGRNVNEVTEAEFLAGCNRFGIDNPMPIQTKRLYLYGNMEDMDKMVDNLFKKYNEPAFLNPERFGSVHPDKNTVPKLGLDGLTLLKEKPKIIDMKETKGRKRAAQKISGAHDLKMLDRLENANKFSSPPVEILCRNYRVKINDILKGGSMR